MPQTSANKTPVIKVDELVAGYGEDIILNNVSFDVYEGEIFIILGGSGCGKSTLLKLLVGLIRPKAGEITLNDYPVSDDASLQKALRQCGILFQSGALFGSMTLAENVALPLHEYTDMPDDYIATLVRIKLAQVNLSGYENYLPSELSGGMKKRAGLARAMALNPKILFFDEPSAGLDPISSAELDQLILHINRTMGTTMVIVTHELDSIYTVASRVIMLDKKVKGIIASGDPHFLKDNSQNKFVRQFFNRQAILEETII
jgi:phospholipid/cholesterol/gamma-HCH transport system ATP-binding protein